MILNETEIKERMESPINLINRLRELSKDVSKSSNSNRTSLIPSLPPKSSDIIPDVDDKLNFGTAKSKAMKIMSLAMNRLDDVVHEIDKPSELARIAETMNKIVTTSEDRSGEDKRTGQIIIYAPQVVQENHFDTIDYRNNEI
jgi:hypothetical protein